MAVAQTSVKDIASPQDTGSWMIIFTDLIALMLTFFVLIFSMSDVNLEKFQAITDNEPTSTETEAEPTKKFDITGIFRKPAIDLDYLKSILTEALSKDSFLAQAQLVRLEDRMVISIPGDLLFAGGLAELSEKSQRAIADLGGVLRNIGNKVTVNGHSQPGKVMGATFTSHWELSLARAVAVANTIRRSGYTEELSAFGFSDSRFKYLSALADEEKKTFGRRVDIVVLATVGGGDEK
jgi:chemotaxis protein MotB